MAKKAYIGVDGVARKIKKGYIGVENFVPRALPSGYTQASYIQSSGTQYVDTGFKPNQDTRVVMDAQILKDPGTSVAIYFGVRWDGGFFELYKAGSSANLTFLYNTTYSQYFTVDYTLRRTVEINKNTATVDGVTKSYPAGTFQSNLPLFLCADNEYGAEKSHTAMRLYSCQIYDNGTLVRDYVPCTNASGTAGLYDLVGAKFYANAGSGAFAAGSSASSVARKIKKAYIGIGGVARPCWSGGELAYYGTITALRAGGAYMDATVVGDYAIFGAYSSSSITTAYNESFVQSAPPNASYPVYNYGGTTVGNYALFGGGYSTSYSGGYMPIVDAYNSSLTKSNPSNLSNKVSGPGSVTIGGYALFAGGSGTSGTNFSTVDTYNSSLTKGTATGLSSARGPGDCCAASERYALFGGTRHINVVDAYNTSLTRTTPSALSSAKDGVAATAIGDYVLFGGGSYTSNGVSYTYYNTVDAYDSSLTRISATALRAKRECSAATTVEGFALFGGGGSSSGSVSAVVDAYDASLTRTAATNLSAARKQLTAVTMGNYALFGGGNTSNTTVDVYTVA